jgi:uncharacterized protein (DUF1697 family)
MTAFVALLRGVNVGKAKRVAMAEWRAQLEALGYTEVATLLNSGNAVFVAKGGTAAKHAAAIAAALERGFGFAVPVVVKSAAELAAIAAGNPYAQAPDPSRLLVAFAPDATTLAALGALAPLSRPPDAFSVGAHAAYVHCVGGILESPVASAMLGRSGASVTTRNWATTLKLRALLEART